MNLRFLVILTSFALGARTFAADRVDYARDVRPILSEYCFACHGPDEQSRKAKLRLDDRASATKLKADEAAIVPKHPDKSVMVARILSADEDEVMPPKKSGKKLNATQIETLKKWIEQGAEYTAHWAFVAPKRPALPEVKTTTWARNAIDRFVLARLEKEGLTPAPEADRRTLARRVALDLTGLPPKIEDVEAFVKDESPDAYEKFVEKHLAMPEWGEHRARYWLDAARYADTHGIHIDNYREMWHYRQWVINAFNQNMTFDRFTVEQLAGDLLPNKTLDQQIASGFQRCNITTSEGGSINDEVLANYAKDRVETTGTVFLGLTVGCAACHDHKFDPVTQKEFYQLAAYFRNTTQNAMDGNQPDTPPILVVPSQDDLPKWTMLLSDVGELRKKKSERLAALKGQFEQWLTTCDEARHVTEPVEPKRQLFALMDSEPVTVSGSACEVAPAPVPSGIEVREGRSKDTKAFFFKEAVTLDFPLSQQIDANKPFTISTWVWPERANGNYLVAAKLDATQKEKQVGWKLEIKAGNPVLTFFTGSPTDSIKMDLGKGKVLVEKAWSHLVVTYDGSRTEAGFQCYVNGRLLTDDRKRDGATGFIAPPPALKGSINNDLPLRLGGDGVGNNKGSGLSEFRIFDRELAVEEVDAIFKWDTVRTALASDDRKTDSVRNTLATLHASRFDPEFADLMVGTIRIDGLIRQIRARSPVTHVMSERENMKPTARILFRGAYDQPRDEVPAATPAVLHAFPTDVPNNRLGLAKWIIATENPLTARVTVNRFWQEVFGTGLVKTSEDFGNTGESPSNPELLDWLAVEFRETGWDVKQMFRLIVTSSTYRQSAQVTREKLEKDPQNRLMSRGPRFRMDGEMIRDAALASSGLLVRKLGGPSVRTYQPDGVWESVAMNGSNTRVYKRDAGENLYRRSMYWFWKRSAPPASMEIFNAPSREVCTVRRERGNTPLQALVTMNDVQFVEAARYLAQRALQSSDDIDKRLDFVTNSVLSRTFDENERPIALASLARFWSRFQKDADGAKKLITFGESKPDESLKVSELAAWTMIASQMMNLDEALNK